MLNETVLCGLGDLHLRSVLERMASQYQARGRRPGRRAFRIARRSPRRPKATTGTRSRPAARASSARSTCASSRCRAARGFEFVDAVKGGAIPTQFIPAVKRASSRCSTAGPLAGFPLQDVRVIVYDGKHHPVDSKEVAFISAGRKAFLDAIAKARPIVLEPIVEVESAARPATWATSPATCRQRRGQVTGTRRMQAGRARRRRARAAGRARRLCGAAEVDDRRSGRMVDGAVALRAGAADAAAATRERIREASAARGGLKSALHSGMRGDAQLISPHSAATAACRSLS